MNGIEYPVLGPSIPEMLKYLPFSHFLLLLLSMLVLLCNTKEES